MTRLDRLLIDLDHTLDRLGARVALSAGLQTADISAQGSNDALSNHARLELHAVLRAAGRAIGALPGLSHSGTGGQFMAFCDPGGRRYQLTFDSGLSALKRDHLAGIRTGLGILERRLASIDWDALPDGLPRVFLVVDRNHRASPILARSPREAAILICALSGMTGRRDWRRRLDRIDCVAERVPSGDWSGEIATA